MARKRKQYQRPTYGPCQFGDGREATYKAAQCCSACYQFFFNWKPKPIGEIIGHRDRTRARAALTDKRVDVLVPMVSHRKVSTLRRKAG